MIFFFSSSPEPTDDAESSFYPVSRPLRNKQNSVDIKKDPDDDDGEDDNAMDEAIPMSSWHDLEPDDDDDEVSVAFSHK